MYGFIREIRGNGPGLLAAAFVSCVPSYISRSVAGSYDNEAVAIFALVFVFYLFVKVNTPTTSQIQSLSSLSLFLDAQYWIAIVGNSHCSSLSLHGVHMSMLSNATGRD